MVKPSPSEVVVVTEHYSAREGQERPPVSVTVFVNLLALEEYIERLQQEGQEKAFYLEQAHRFRGAIRSAQAHEHKRVALRRDNGVEAAWGLPQVSFFVKPPFSGDVVDYVQFYVG